jgi:hypothetical protein
VNLFVCVILSFFLEGEKMAGSLSSSSMAVMRVVAIFGLLFAIVSPAVGESQSPAPAPASDGKNYTLIRMLSFA